MKRHMVAGLKNIEEAALAVAVADAMGATAIAHDVGGSQGLVDALLKYPDGRTAALEVTSHAGTGVHQRDGVLASHGRKLSAPGEWAWVAHLESVTHLPEFKQKVASIATYCEANDIADPERLHSWDARRTPDSAWLLDQADIRLRALPEASAPAIHLLPAGRGSRVDETLEGLPTALAEVLAHENQVRHIAKLNRCDQDERHLCVRIREGGLPDAVAAALFGKVDSIPLAPIPLPAEIAGLWFVALWSSSVCGVSRDGWTVADVPTEETMRRTSDWFDDRD